MPTSSRQLSTTLRVLVIDDDADVRQILGERLRREGFDTAFAESGEQALVQWLSAREQGQDTANRPYDVLIIDIQMLGMSGIEMLKLVRQVDQEVTILMISGLGDLSRAVQSLRQGADDYISKPIKIWDLRDRIATARGRRRALKQRAEGESQAKAQRSTHAPTSHGNTKGLEWGAWITPGASSDRSDSAHSNWPAEERSTRAAGSDASDHRSEGRGSDSQAYGRAHATSSPSNPIELNRESPSRGRVEERAALHSEKGREKSSGSSGAQRSGPGESPVSGSGMVAEGMAPGREVPPPARPAPRLGGSSLRPGGSSAIPPSSPLDAFLHLAVRMERQREGWRNHGQRVAQRCLKVAEGLAAERHLEERHLRGLVLAAELHGLGLVRARGQSFREFSPYEHGTAPTNRDLFATLAQGQEAENLELVSRILEAYRGSEVDTSWSHPNARAAADSGREAQKGEVEVAMRVLNGVETRRLQAAKPGSERQDGSDSDNPIDDLVRIFELADHWVHLTSPGLEGLGPQHAHVRLSEVLVHRPDFPWEQALQTLLTAS